MVAVAAVNQAAGISEFASGKFTSDGTVATVTVGFLARYVTVYNETDVISWEKYEGQASTASHKTVAVGTKTADATSAIVINTDNKTLTFSTGLCGTGKVIYWQAYS